MSEIVIGFATKPYTAPTPPTITNSSPLPPATVGTAYSNVMTAAGGQGPPFTWSITSDSPDTGSWLSINASSGVLSGTPGTAETETVTIKALDSSGAPVSKTFSLVVRSASTGQVKFHGGNWWQSYGGGNAEIQSYATTAFPLLQGFLNSGQPWGLLETSEGVYDFSAFVTEFNYLQSQAPGARYALQIIPETFGNYGTNANQTIYSGDGPPNYILSNSAYGPAGNNGTQYGYQLQTNGSGGFNAVTTAIWRPAVMARLAALFVALANTSFVTTAGPYAGQTFTFDTHPLIEAITTGIDAFAGPYNDYTSSAFLSAAKNNLYPAAVAAFPHTTIGYVYDFLAGDTHSGAGSMAQALADMYAARVAMFGPDTYAQQRQSDAQQLYSGGSWNGSSYVPGGGTDYRNLMPYFGSVQSPDYGKPYTGGTSTPAQIMSNVEYLDYQWCCWTMAGENAPYSGTAFYGPFYTAYIQSLAEANPNLNDAVCPAAYVAVGGCNST